MKRILYVFLSCTWVSFMTSCAEQFSCDPIINEWAKDNIEYYSKAERDEIIQLPLSRQNAIYVGLSGEKKIELWKAKQRLVRDLNILSEQEYVDFSKIFDFLQPYHYESEKGRNELIQYAESWKNIMVTRYAWDEEKLFDLSHIWMTKEEFVNSAMYDMLMTKVDVSDDIVKPKVCECIYAIYCATSGLGTQCSSYPACKQGDNYCGIVGSSNCTGTCH